MTKSDLIKKLSELSKITEKQAEAVIKLMFQMMTEAMQRNERIEIRGFGSFKIKNYDGYVGRNPATGDKVQVPPKRLPQFRVGKDLKKRVDYTFSAG